MVDSPRLEDAATAMRQINEAWLIGRVEDLEARFHPEIVMVFPGFSGRARGRHELLAGFRDFCENATIHQYREHDHQIDIVGDTAVINFRYEMVYERSGQRSRATGRDVWVFQYQDRAWIAVWRTMLDLQEEAA
jgi:hypothetical protein